MTGLPVKTIRYYSDSGLLPVTERSTGGHRRYGPEALKRLRLIRQLRSLELPIAVITEIVTGERSLSDLMTSELLSTQQRLSQLRWRQATLEALDDCPPDVRLQRLQILSRVQKLPEAQQALTDHWTRSLPTAMPKRWHDRMVTMLSPTPPGDPSATSALAYAELHLLVATPDFTRWTQDHEKEMRDAPSFYAEVDHAAELTVVSLMHGLPPGPGDAVDAFVSAHARACRETDTPAFRLHLHSLLAQSSGFDDRLQRYWRLVGTVTKGQSFNMAEAHIWLTRSLAASLPAQGDRPTPSDAKEGEGEPFGERTP